MKIYFGYFMGDTNIGDKVCCPMDYYDFPLECEKVNVYGLEEHYDKLRENVFIYGGGGLLHLPSPDYYGGYMGYIHTISELNAVKIAWGIGHNIHHPPEQFGQVPINWPEVIFKSFSLIGGRDNIQSPYQNYNYIPCASCKHPLFQKKYRINHETTLMVHADGIDLGIDNAERTYSKGDSFEKVITTIGTGKALVTNSYHGAYWGSLLGRKVVVWKPFSTKFSAINSNVEFAFTKEELQEKIKIAKVDKTFLKRSVELNDNFHKKVINFLKGEK